MKQSIFRIKSNRKIANSVYEMILCGDTSAITKPGQFVNIKIEGLFLRRPISVCDYSSDTLTIIYKAVGEGTEKMAEMTVGEQLDILSGLGNGYNIDLCGDKPLLIGGGVGVPPLYRLCKELSIADKDVSVILGFNTKDEVFYEKEFMSVCKNVYITTADGSYGTKGFVTDVMKNLDYSYFYTCGPMPMFMAIESIAKTSGQYSFEERMGCGFGACMGCSCETKYGGSLRICKDGPVLEREIIKW